MMTQTHLLIAAAALARRDASAINVAVVAGALLPDAALYGLAAWAGIVEQRSAKEIFETLYFTPDWQTAMAVGNSFPLWFALLGLGMALKRDWLKLLAAAGLLHLCFDFPLHHDDAHSHFWPVTMWKFVSPVSYWDPRHFGGVVSVIELLLSLALVVVLWRRFPALWVRGLLAVLSVLYVAVPAYFLLSFGGAPPPAP
jgi:hypothetical protein